MRRQRLMHPPLPLRRARLDNLALVPGSLLPQIAACQEMANELPANAVLIVLPAKCPLQKQALLRVAKLLAQEGHQIRIVSEQEVARRPSYVQSQLDL